VKDVDFSQIFLFADLDPEEVAKVTPLFWRTAKRSGETVIEEGDTGNEMYILVQGRIRISKSMLIRGMQLPLAELSKSRKVLAVLDADRYPTLGEIALLDEDTRSATVECLEDSEFLVTDRKRFLDLVQQEPAIGSKLLMAIGTKLAFMVRRNNTDLVKLTTALALALGKTVTT
jgi:CRP-like cAMP-binding protein